MYSARVNLRGYYVCSSMFATNFLYIPVVIYCHAYMCARDDFIIIIILATKHIRLILSTQ
jgi:hypothetical protein